MTNQWLGAIRNFPDYISGPFSGFDNILGGDEVIFVITVNDNFYEEKRFLSYSSGKPELKFGPEGEVAGTVDLLQKYGNNFDDFEVVDYSIDARHIELVVDNKLAGGTFEEVLVIAADSPFEVIVKGPKECNECDIVDNTKTISTSVYRFTWNSTAVENGQYTFSARAISVDNRSYKALNPGNR